MDVRQSSDHERRIHPHDPTDRHGGETGLGRGGSPAAGAAGDEARRWAFLADASRALDAETEYEPTLAAVCRLAVPVLADYCVLEVAEPAAGPPRRLVSDGRDVSTGKLLDELRQPAPWATSRPDLLAAVLGGHPRVCHRPPASELAALVGPVDAAIHERLGVTACVALPLPTPGRPMAALLLASTSPVPRYGESDLLLAREFAARAGLALARAWRYRDACEAVRRKDELLAMVAHELRTPLGCVLTSLEALARFPSPAPAASDLSWIVLRQARRLARLVDDLVDAGRDRAGGLPLRVEPLDLRTVVHDCLAMLRIADRLAEHAVSCVCARDAVLVEADRLRLEQVVGNLVDNAVKYTPRDGAIRLAVLAEDGYALLRVEDTGAGIPGDLLPRVFEPFVRGADDTHGGGLGLGLALVRRIVEQHGGTVAVHSGRGDGTAVVVRLPLAVASARRTAALSS